MTAASSRKRSKHGPGTGTHGSGGSGTGGSGTGTHHGSGTTAGLGGLGTGTRHGSGTGTGPGRTAGLGTGIESELGGESAESTTGVQYRLRDAVSQRVQGFLRHPEGFPLRCRRLLLERQRPPNAPAPGDVGLIFRSARFIRPGTRMEISIPLRGETQRFRGEVVMVRAGREGYEIGLWLDSEQDCSRARLVEQICHIEKHLEARRRAVGVTDRARGWLSRFAASLSL